MEAKEGMPDSKGALERAGLLKPEPVAAGAEGAGAATPPAKPDTPPALPTFGELPVPGAKKDVPLEVPPENTDAQLPANSQKVVTALRTHVKNLEAQLKAAKTAVDPEEIKTLRNELTQAHDMIAELDLVRDPRFQAEFDVPRAQVMDQIKTVLEEYGAVADDIIPNLQGKSFKDQIAFLKENAQDATGALIPMLRQLAELDTNRATRLQNKQATKQQLMASQQEAEQHLMNQAFELTFKAQVDAGSPFFREIPGEDVFNKSVADLKTYAKSIGTDTSPMNRAKLATLAAEGQIWKAMMQQEQQRRVALEKQLEAFGKGIPRTTGSTPGSGGGGALPETMTAAEAARRAAARL